MTDRAGEGPSAQSTSGYSKSLAELIETMVAVELSAAPSAEDSALDSEYLADLQGRVVTALSAHEVEVDGRALLIAALDLWADRP